MSSLANYISLIDLSGAADGDVLTYNSAEPSKFELAAPAGGGASFIGCSLNLYSGFAIAAADPEIALPWDAEFFSPVGCSYTLGASGQIITITDAGIYQICVDTSWTAINFSNYYVRIKIDGVTKKEARTTVTTNQWFMLNAELTIEIPAGGEVEVYIDANDASFGGSILGEATQFAPVTTMSIRKVG